jgi:chemotaxis protein MotA
MQTFGVVAATLGVIITMGAIGGPPAEFGAMVGAALVGTFVDLLLYYYPFVPWPRPSKGVIRANMRI